MIIASVTKINCGNTFTDAKTQASNYKEDSIMITLLTRDSAAKVSAGFTKAELEDLLKEFEPASLMTPEECAEVARQLKEET